jgi:hypothetical protein
MHSLAHHDAAGLGDSLQPGGQVHRLAHGAFLGRGHYDQPGGDADAHREPSGIGHIELRQRLDSLQPRTNRSLGLAFVRQRVAEEGDDAIAKPLEEITFEAGHARRAGILVTAHDVLQHFGIEPRGEVRIAHHVAEQHGELAAFGRRCRGRRSSRDSKGIRR